MLIRLVNNIEEFKRILHVTVLCAPNRFAVRDFLDKDEQLTLETAYRDLNYGMQFVVKKVKKPEAVTQVQHILDESLALYKQGEEQKAAHMLQDLEDIIFGKPSYRP
jgi:hypothetical protein